MAKKKDAAAAPLDNARGYFGLDSADPVDRVVGRLLDGLEELRSAEPAMGLSADAHFDLWPGGLDAVTDAVIDSREFEIHSCKVEARILRRLAETVQKLADTWDNPKI